MLRHFTCVWFSVTLWTIVHQAPLSMGFTRQEYWSGLPCPPPKNVPDPGVEPTSLMSPALQVGFLPLAPSTYEKNTICHFPDSRQGEEDMDSRQLLRDVPQFSSQETQFSGGESILSIMRKGSHSYRDFREKELGAIWEERTFTKAWMEKRREKDNSRRGTWIRERYYFRSYSTDFTEHMLCAVHCFRLWRSSREESI